MSFSKLISETDTQRTGSLHNVPVQRHGAPTANCLGDLDGHRVRRLKRDHVTIHPVGDELHRAGAESGAQQTVERRRPAAALQMAEHTYTRLFAGPFLDFRRDNPANPAEPGLAILFIGRSEKSAALLTRTFSHDDEGKFFPLLFALGNLGADAFVAEGDFRDQNDVAAA